MLQRVRCRAECTLEAGAPRPQISTSAALERRASPVRPSSAARQLYSLFTHNGWDGAQHAWWHAQHTQHKLSHAGEWALERHSGRGPGTTAGLPGQPLLCQSSAQRPLPSAAVAVGTTTPVTGREAVMLDTMAPPEQTLGEPLSSGAWQRTGGPLPAAGAGRGGGPAGGGGWAGCGERRRHAALQSCRASPALLTLAALVVGPALLIGVLAGRVWAGRRRPAPGALHRLQRVLLSRGAAAQARRSQQRAVAAAATAPVPGIAAGASANQVEEALCAVQVAAHDGALAPVVAHAVRAALHLDLRQGWRQGGTHRAQELGGRRRLLLGCRPRQVGRGAAGRGRPALAARGSAPVRQSMPHNVPRQDRPLGAGADVRLAAHLHKVGASTGAS